MRAKRDREMRMMSSFFASAGRTNLPNQFASSTCSCPCSFFRMNATQFGNAVGFSGSGCG